MEEARESFEKERDKILSEIPESVKSMFGQIGFAESEENGGEILPVLVLSPYDVPPKPVRDIYWFDMFSKGKRTKKLDDLAYLVYHYGSDDPDDCYSFIEQSDFVLFESGKSKGYARIPDAIQEKLNAGSELTEEEQMRVRGIHEMEEDLAKEPEERKRGALDFKERHEQLALKEPPTKRQKK